MTFAIGDINVAIIGEHATARMLGDILDPVRTESDRVDLELRFVGRLPPAEGQAFTKVGRYKVAGDALRVECKCWCYEIRRERDRLVVTVAAIGKPLPGRIAESVRKSWKYFHTHGGGASLRTAKRCVYSVLIPVLELALLPKDSTLAHCSAVSASGKVVIFASLGGVGKTSLMSALVRDECKFLSDDLCVIHADGRVSLFPLPMHIYKYHEQCSRELVRKMLGARSTFDRMLWSVCSRVKRPDKLVRWIGPDRVFGRQQLARDGRLSVVVHMQRCSGLDALGHRRADPAEVASLMASTILVEVGALPKIAASACSCGGPDFVPDIAAMHSDIRRIYASAFREADIHLIDIPPRATPDDVLAFLRKNKLLPRAAEGLDDI